MQKRIHGMVCALAMLTVVGAVSAETLYDSNGFERPPFAVGGLDGQDAWLGGGLGSGAAPLVVAAPEPVLGQQAVRLEVGDTFEDSSLMNHDIALPSIAGQIVTVSFDIYRPTPPAGKLAQNLWWFWWDDGDPIGGLQWDGGLTLPYSESDGAGSAPTVFDRYANITMVWDFQQMKSSSWYDGALIDDGLPITGITQLTSWAILLSHDSDTGTGSSVAYIDNFQITAVPEPASLALLAAGALLAIRRRR